MTRALFLGSIGTLAETSMLQLVAYNQAFREAGLPWVWSQTEYQRLLKNAGGRRRIDDYASSRGVVVDAEALHKRKSAVFQQLLTVTPLKARPGVRETIRFAAGKGLKLGLVTTTSWDNVDAILRSLDLPLAGFDVVTTSDTIARPKPAEDAYTAALDYLKLDPTQVVAVEDNPDGAKAAKRAGLRCVGLIGEMHDVADFPELSAYQEALDITKLVEIQPVA